MKLKFGVDIFAVADFDDGDSIGLGIYLIDNAVRTEAVAVDVVQSF